MYGWKMSLPPGATELSRKLLEVMRTSGCHGIEINRVADRSLTLGLFLDLATTGSWIVSIDDYGQNPLVDLDVGWDRYWEMRSGHLKRRLNVQDRQLRHLGHVRFQDAAQVSDWRYWFEQSLLLEVAGWKGQKDCAILQRANELKF
jgi:hypothetical protein